MAIYPNIYQTLVPCPIVELRGYLAACGLKGRLYAYLDYNGPTGTSRDSVAEGMLADSQVHRFLVLHKELDPDDDELTRTRKVRRGFISEKYAVLIDALYGGKASQYIETEVKFEDGRKGKVAADLQIRDAKIYPAVQGRAA